MDEFTGKPIRFQPEEHYAQQQYDVVLLYRSDTLLVIWRRRAHLARLWLHALFACVVIVLAVVIAITHIALPWIAGHPD